MLTVSVQVLPGASSKPFYATLAQLVERNLAKVEVTPDALKIGNLVCRSKSEKLIRNDELFSYLLGWYFKEVERSASCRSLGFSFFHADCISSSSARGII